MQDVNIWVVVLALAMIVMLFAMFAFLLYQARKTHTRRVGGRTYWDIVYGRFPRIPPRRGK
jgi:hypothetical protein